MMLPTPIASSTPESLLFYLELLMLYLSLLPGLIARC